MRRSAGGGGGSITIIFKNTGRAVIRTTAMLHFFSGVQIFLYALGRGRYGTRNEYIGIRVGGAIVID